MSKRASRSHAKSGPGRYHGAGTLIIDPTTGAILGTTQPHQRRAPAIQGGNWQGKQYLTYAEHDRITRTCALRYASSGPAYEAAKRELIASR